MRSPEEALRQIELRQQEIEAELARVRAGFSPDAPAELKEAELLEEWDQLARRAESISRQKSEG
ncbi:hypothetical protein [Bremerella cremea]|uniref:hypothetical protein n=1 Tax=Bremerella cremea TaxID=1031537 RepID=UPI0031EA8F05